MKKLLSLLLLLLTGMVNAQIVSIPDATLKAKLLAANTTDANNKIAQDFSDNWMVIDANGDGEIQLSEAQAVKFLAVSHYAITDVTGLTSFSNLQTLSLNNCRITSLDLNALTNLTSLSCFNLIRLTSLSINNLTNLTELNCISLYSLASLNISNLTNLIKLNCMYSELSVLNINGLTNLRELNCMGNLLTNLNGLPITLTKLNCSQNMLSNLNINGLTNLSELDCSYNQLTNLNGLSPNIIKLNCASNKLNNFNVFGLTNLNELNCNSNQIPSLNVNALTNLTKLYCSENQLTSLNLNGLTNLTILECGYNDDLASITLTNLPSLKDFRIISRVDSSGISLSHLTSLNLSGLPNLQKLDCTNGILTSLDLNGLTNLTELICPRNQISSLNLSNLPNLQKLSCETNPISDLDVSNMTNLVELTCAGGYFGNGQIVSRLNTLNVSGAINLKKLSCYYSQLTTIDLTGLIYLEEVYCDGIPNNLGRLTSLNVNGLTSLKKLSCTNQQLTSLNVNNLVNLTELYCSYNHISSLDLTGLINLKILDYNYNELSNLNLVNLPSLTDLNCSYNQLVTLNVLDLTNLKSLICNSNSLTTLDLSGLSSLETLDFSYNQLTLSNVSGISTNLKSLGCKFNNLTSLDVSGLTNLETLSCSQNQLPSIDVSSLVNLKFLDLGQNQLTSLDLTNLTNLEFLNVYQNNLTDLNINGLNNLASLFCAENQITSLDLSNHTNLTGLDYSYNSIPNLDVNYLTNLTYLGCAGTQSTVLDVSNLTKLQSLFCYENQLTTLDISNAPYMNDLRCYDNQLTNLFIKNGKNESNLNFTNNPALQYICADGSQIETIQTTLNGLGMNATVCNSYCSFTPGGNHNTITGICIFDADNNGCDVTDVVNPFVRLNVNDGTVNGATVTNINGTYNFYTDAGVYTIAPNTENPTWFTFSPTSANFTFENNNNNISTQNFCINALGLHKDIEVVLSQVETARPGFDAKYKIVFKNKGNQMQSGAVTLQFDDTRTDFISSTPAVDTTVENLLSWNFTNLMPFENRSIELTLNVNSPVETPAVNNGDVLNFTASVTPITGDEFPNDNTFSYNQTVLGSFDPNDIICLEGNTISPTEIGKYLHYVVNFENTGTFYAENVVVKLEVDSSKFDMNSLQLLNSSNPSSTRIRGNIVEFVMQNINLAAAAGSPPVGGHGDVLFKIKTKDNLVNNDTVLQRAGIYFDYNFPVITNDAETTFAELSNPIQEFDNSVKIYPNPTNSIINIDSKFNIESIQLYDIQGRLLETILESSATSKLDISSKSNGIYFLKIKTEKGSKVEKIVKE